jgi:hypothetical protein
MQSKSFYIILLLGSLAISSCHKRTELFVAPNGNDKNSGSKKAPLSSIKVAKEKAVRLIHKYPNKDITIWFEDGTYFLDEPLEFTNEDSGLEGQSVVYKAVNDKRVLLSGGIKISQWKKNSDGIWESQVIDHSENLPTVRELFIDGMRAKRARFPNENYLRVLKAGEDRRTNFFFNKGDFPVPTKPMETELVLLHDWSISRIGLDTVVVKDNQLFAKDSIGAKNPAFFNIDNWEKNPRYYLENALEFIDEDNEWCYSPSDGKLYLKLSDSAHPDSLDIIVPSTSGLLRFPGSREKPVSNIRFEGFRFSYSSWQIPDWGYGGIQACHYGGRDHSPVWGIVPAAVQGKWVDRITFANCTFEHLGGGALWLGEGSSNCVVSNCLINDVSGNGIMIGEGRDRMVDGKPWWQSATDEVAIENTIENSIITDCGKQFHGAVGIWCGLTAYTVLRNNEVFNLPYTGVSIGWMWNPQPTPSRGNIADGNHIHDIMNILSDGGGIYMLGLQPDSRLVNNHIHDVTVNAGRAESNGMFLDEGITDVVVEGNLIYNIAKSPLRFHKATTNLVKDNILVCGHDIPPIRYNRTSKEDIEKVNNKVLYSSYEEDMAELEKIIKNWNQKMKVK